MSSVRGAVALALVLMAALAGPSAAANWREMGNSDSSLDKIYLDMDSIKTEGGFKTVHIMTVLSAPDTNINGITMDRRVVVTGVDCASRKGANIQTVGYLGEKQTGHSPVTADWQTKIKPFNANGVNGRIMDVVCGQGAPAPGPAGPGAPAAGQVQVGSGSGIFVNSDGMVLTNAHVINGCKTIMVKAYNATPTSGLLDSVDPKNDLALIRTRSDYGVPAMFRPQNRPARLGENIGVIGYPLLGMLSNEPKATFGQVNSVAGMNNDYTLLQISAPIQPGNSGGPVYDQNGQVLGIVVSTASPALAAKIGVVPQNINFAIRSEIAQIFMTAHGVEFRTSGFSSRMDTADIAAAGEKSTAQILCLK